MDLNINESLKEIKRLQINVNDNALLSMILVELHKLNQNIEKLNVQNECAEMPIAEKTKIKK